MTIDVIPATAITGGPTEGSTVTSKSATLTFTGAGSAGSYQCKLESAAYAACTSPVALTGLAAGPHTFTVKAIDAEGDSATDARNWSVANDAPSAGGDRAASGSAVPGTAFAVEVTPTLADPQGVVPAEARIVSIPSTVALTRGGAPIAAGDNVALVGGKLQFTLTASSPADAVIAYKLVDAADSTLLSPASDLSVDVQPVLSMDGGPANGSSSTSAGPAFAFSGAGAGGSYACATDGAAASGCSPPAQLSNLRWGAHSFFVRATDADGDTDSRTIAWTITGSLNAPTILAGPAAETGDRTATITFQGDPGAVPQCSIDGSAYEWCADSKSFTNLPLGPHAFSVRQVDAAGNTSPAATRKWKIDVAFKAGENGMNIKSVKALVNDAVAATENLVGVGCELNRGSLRQCDVDAYADVAAGSRKARKASLEKIGTGSVVLTERGQTSAVVDVKLNALGRKLMAANPGGVPVTMKVTAQPFDTDMELVSTSKSTMHPPEMLIVPSHGMFAGDSYDIGKAGLLYVKAVAKLLVGAKRVRCEGYSDTTASTKRAKAIGYLRAKAVCDALEDAGVTGNVGALGVGSGHARGSNATANGRRMNRRVEIRAWF
jgi:outer membrane protein OmpA-like peptidoglycan-associated protein